MEFQLVIVRGRGASTTVKLADGVTTVGRQDDCHLRIKSSQVSRKHCELFEKKGMLLVKDLGSSNGTYVNGKRIQEQRVLEPGDELTIGQLLFKVTKVGEAPATATSPATAAVKPGDTAVVEAIPAQDNEEFEIEFDVDTPDPETIPTVADTAAAPPANSEPKTEPKSKPKPVAEAEVAAPADAKPDQLLGDDAIADFLLDIKFDED